jgi:flagellar hook capping protein FlgD
MPLGSRLTSLPAAWAGATLLVLAAPIPASAKWPLFGRAICSASGDQQNSAITGDGADGAILTWVDFRDTTVVNIYAGHVMSTGEVDAAWPMNGRALRADATAVADEPENPASPAIVPDGSGGAIVVWQDGRSSATGIDIFAQHVLALGGLDPAWPRNGTGLCVIAGTQSFPTVASDGAGGAIVAWTDGRPGASVVDVYAQHVLASGLVDPQWPVNGVAVSAAPGPQALPTLVGDGVGGVIVTWFDGRSAATSDDDIYAQHILASGVADPAWPVNGRALCTAPGPQFQQKIVSDGSGGAVVTWDDDRTGVDHIYAHHVLATGAVDPAWPADGRALTDRTSSEEFPSLVSDGSGGAVVVWQSPGSGFIDVNADHVTGTGMVDPAWPVGGALVRRSPAVANSKVAPDGVGGAIVAWQEAARIAAQHVVANGTFDPAYPDSGRTISGPFARQILSGLVAAGPSGAIVGWSDVRFGAGLDVYAMQVLDAIPTDAPAPEAPGFAFHCPWPDPARGATTLRFSLPSQAGVRLAVYDIRGRRVRELVSGSRPAGGQTVVWNFCDGQGKPVGAGIYFAKLEVGSRTAIRKLVLVR